MVLEELYQLCPWYLNSDYAIARDPREDCSDLKSFFIIII